MTRPALLALSGFLVVSAHAALSVTNGGFGAINRNGAIVDGGGWFESGTANWVEGSWSSTATPGPGSDSILLLMDGGSANLGYLYQSLGTVTADEIALGQLHIRADFAEKTDGETNTAVFTVFKGSYTGATGTDIATGGLPVLGTFTLDAAAQGCTQARDINNRNNQVFVGAVDLSTLTAGDEIWMRIGESRDTAFTTGDLMVDNVTVTAVPEPSAYALGAAGLMAAVAFRRRRRA